MAEYLQSTLREALREQQPRILHAGAELPAITGREALGDMATFLLKTRGWTRRSSEAGSDGDSRRLDRPKESLRGEGNSEATPVRKSSRLLDMTGVGRST